eukprot:gene1900-2234_t
MYRGQLSMPFTEHSYPCLQELVIKLPCPCLCFPSARCVPKLRLLQLHITDITTGIGYTTLQGLEVCFEMVEGQAVLILSIIRLLPKLTQLQSLRLVRGLQQLTLWEENSRYSLPAGLLNCSALSRLELLIDEPAVSTHVHDSAAGALSAAAGGQLGAGRAEAQQYSQTRSVQASLEPQGRLTSLQSLKLGDLGAVTYQAPVASFAPDLTALRETSWWFGADYADMYAEEMGTALPVDLDIGGIDALQGLQQLQVVDLDLFCLDRHAAYPSLTSLPSLCELRLEVVGTDSKSLDWLATYDWEEDVLLWKNQRSLEVLQLNGSAVLGAVMMAERVQHMLPACLPRLQSIKLLRCDKPHHAAAGHLGGWQGGDARAGGWL